MSGKEHGRNAKGSRLRNSTDNFCPVLHQLTRSRSIILRSKIVRIPEIVYPLGRHLPDYHFQYLWPKSAMVRGPSVLSELKCLHRFALGRWSSEFRYALLRWMYMTVRHQDAKRPMVLLTHREISNKNKALSMLDE